MSVTPSQRGTNGGIAYLTQPTAGLVMTQMPATEAEVESLARVLCIADDFPRKRSIVTGMSWRDYRGQATAALAWLAIKRAHEAG